MTPGPLIYDGYWIPNRKLADTVRQQGYPYDYLAGSNLGESHLNSMELGGVYGIRKASEFYAFAKEMLGDLYEKYDFENLVQVTDENVDRATRHLASLGLNMTQRMGGVAINLRFGRVRR